MTPEEFKARVAKDTAQLQSELQEMGLIAVSIDKRRVFSLADLDRLMALVRSDANPQEGPENDCRNN